MSVAKDLLIGFERVLIKELTSELEAQGHSLTGSLTQSIEIRARQGLNVIFFEGIMNDYGLSLDQGVTAPKIPFSGSGGGGGVSAYIQGLKRFALLRGMASSDKEATGIAFAIANVQKKEGAPTSGSGKFSKNGRRKGWISSALLSSQDALEKIISDGFFEEFTLQLDDAIKKVLKKA